MKHSILSLIAAATTCAGLALTPLHGDETWDGGNGTWDFNNTPNWNGSNTWSTNDQAAVFDTTPGTVTVDNSLGQVGDNYLYFNSSSTSSTWDVTGGTIDEAIAGNGNNLLIDQDGGSGNVTIDSNMNVDTTTNTDRYNIYSNSASSLTLNGNITFGNQDGLTGNTNRSLIIGSTNNNAVFYLNGTYADSSASGGTAINLRLAEGGATQDTYFINGNISGLTGGVQIGSGNVVVDPTANTGTSTIFMYDDQGYNTENVALYAAQGDTITNSVYISMKYEFDSTGTIENPGNATFGNYDATNTTFSGNIVFDNSGGILNTAANGRANFTGDFGGHSPNGLTKTGAGVAVLGTNDYGIQNDFTTNSTRNNVAIDIQQGTVLANNGSNASAFGNNSGKVQVEAGATLGGNGGTSGNQLTQAMAATAVIAPGDAGQANLGIHPSIGTLDLQGGLEADNGLVMDFKLTGEGLTPGTSNDFLEVSSFTLGGKVTVNLTALDALETGAGNDYTIFSDTNTFDTEDATDFTIVAPTGYKLDSTYGNGVGGGYDYTGGVLTVQLVATPEPSTWAMMFGGLVLLAVRLRRKLARQVG